MGDDSGSYTRPQQHRQTETRLTALFSIDAHAEVEATWTMYQRTVAAYRHPDGKTGRTMMAALITTLSAGVPRPLQEVITFGRTLKGRAADILAYLDRPGHFQRADRSNQRPPRTPPRLSPRLSQSHQLHRQIPTGNRQIQTPTTPPIVKSRQTPALSHHRHQRV